MEAEASFGIGSIGGDATRPGYMNLDNVAARGVLHAAAGGLFSVARGDKFQSGFLAAGFVALAGPQPAQSGDYVGLFLGTAESAVIGGLGSALGGGKFENGAETGAFEYLFNAALHPSSGQQSTSTLTYDQIKDLVAENNLSGVDDTILIAIAYHETRFDPSQVNPETGATGLLQVFPSSQGEVARNYGVGYELNYNLSDPGQNIQVGSLVLRLFIKWYGGDLSAALDKGYAGGAYPGFSNQIISTSRALNQNPTNPMSILRQQISN